MAPYLQIYPHVVKWKMSFRFSFSKSKTKDFLRLELRLM